MKYPIAAAFAACVLCAAPAFAQQAPSSPAPAVSPSPSPSPRAWQASGYVATQYTTLQNASALQFTNGGNARVFDTLVNAPTLNALNVQLVKTGTIGGKLELTGGTNADIIASYPESTPGFDVTQAYLSYTSGPFTLQGGKFATLAGAEVIEDPADVNISRSILFGYAVPFTHTGARLTFAPSALFSLIAGVNNGWDNLKGNGTGARTAELGLAYNGAVFSLTAQGYSGTERITNVPYSPFTGKRSLLDLVGTYHVSTAVTLQANYDAGRQTNVGLLDATGTPLVNAAGFARPPGTANWNGIAGYANWQINPRWASSLRVEGFHDGGGYRTGYDQKWGEQTLTLGYSPSPQITFRGEARYDNSSAPVFVQNSLGVSNLSTYEGQILIKF